MTRIKDKAPGQPCGLATRRNQMSKSCAGLFFITDVTAFVEIVKYFFITMSFSKFNLLFVFSRDVMCKCFSNLFLYSATALVRYLGKHQVIEMLRIVLQIDQNNNQCKLQSYTAYFH